MASAPRHADLLIECSPTHFTVLDKTGVKVFERSATIPYAGRSAVLAISRNMTLLKSVTVPNTDQETIRTILSRRLGELLSIEAVELAFDFSIIHEGGASGKTAWIAAVPAEQLRKALEHLAASGVSIIRTVPAASGGISAANALHVADALVVGTSGGDWTFDVIAGGAWKYSRESPATSAIDLEIARTLSAAQSGPLPVLGEPQIESLKTERQLEHPVLEFIADGKSASIGMDILLPEEFDRRRRGFELRAKRTTGLLGAIAAIVVLATGLSSYHSVESTRATTASQSRSLEQWTKAANARSAAESTIRAKRDALKRALKPAQAVADVITVASNDLPLGAWLNTLTLQRGNNLAIRGSTSKSSSIIKYLAELQSSARFRDARLTFAGQSGTATQQTIQFSISAFPTGNLPISTAQQALGGSQ